MGMIIDTPDNLRIALEARRESFTLSTNEYEGNEGQVFCAAIDVPDLGKSVSVELSYDQLDPLIEGLQRLRAYAAERIPVKERPPTKRLSDEISEWENQAEKDGNTFRAQFCATEREGGYNLPWRSIEVVVWGETPRGYPLQTFFPPSPLYLDPSEFERFSGSMRKSSVSISWPLWRIEKLAATDADILEWEDARGRFFLRSELQKLLRRIRDQLNQVR